MTPSSARRAPGALAAFIALSGEVHASAIGVAFDDTRLPREAVLDRLAESYDAPSPSRAKTVQTYGFSTPTQVFSALGAGLKLVGASRRERQFRDGWQRYWRFHPWCRRDAIRPLSAGHRWRLRQFEHLGPIARFDRDDLSDLYRALRRGQRRSQQLRSGAFYANNHYGLDRVVSFPGFYQTAGSGYGGDTAEVFGEAGWRVAVAAPVVSAAAVEPFVELAGSIFIPRASPENSGPASLVGGSENAGYGMTTFGLRSEATLFVNAPMTVDGMIGWQHVYGGPAPNSSMAFASTPLTPFSIAGAPSRLDAGQRGARVTGVDEQNLSPGNRGDEIEPIVIGDRSRP